MFPKKITSGFLIFLLICPSIISSAEDLDSRMLFFSFLEHYRNGRYDSSIEECKQFIADYPSHRYIQTTRLILTKSFFNSSDYESAKNTALELKELHPRGVYSQWTTYMTAACEYKVGLHEVAVTILADLAKKTKNQELRRRSLNALRYTILPEMDEDIFWTMIEESGLKRAEFVFGPIVPQKITAEKREDKIEPKVDILPVSGIARIGLLTPLRGKDSEAGRELLKGVSTALRETTIQGLKIELIVEDIGSDLVTSINKTRALADSGVVAIIGPVYGESTVISALEASHHNIPFIAPTAIDRGISTIGENVFQLSLTPHDEARALAEFAVERLGIKNAAVIASADSWGQAIVTYFTESLQNRKIPVIGTEFYNPGDPSQFEGVLHGLRRTLLPGISAPAPDSTGNFSRDILNSVDCILISAPSRDALQFASLIKRYGIETIILGDSGWGGPENFSGSREAVEGVYLLSPGNYQTTTRPETLKEHMLLRDKELQTRISRRGYDACAILLHSLNRGARNREEITSSIKYVEDFRGLASRYTIDPVKRINTAVDFIRIRDGVYEPVPR